MALKRGGFKPKTLDEVKARQAVKRLKSPSKRVKAKKRPSVRLLKDKLWNLCKEIVRARDENVCVVCGKTGLEGSGWHTGHLIPRSTCGALLRYDIRNLHSSCYYCNINLGGNGAIYLRSLINTYGQEFVDGIFEDKKKYAKDDAILLQKKIDEYEQIRTWSKVELFNYTKNYKTDWCTT